MRLSCQKSAIYYGMAGLRWLHSLRLREPDGRLLAEDLQLLETLEARIVATEALIDELATGDQALPWLRSLPGIGDFFAKLICYEVDGIMRFRTAKKFAG